MIVADLSDEIRVLQGRRPENHLVDPGFEQPAGVHGRSDSAPELDGDVDGVQDRVDRCGVFPLALERAVEVHQVEPLGPGVDPATRRFDGVAVPLSSPAFAPHQLDDLPALEVHCGDDFELVHTLTIGPAGINPMDRGGVEPGHLCERGKLLSPLHVNSGLMPTVEYVNYEALDDQGWDLDDDDLFEKAADAGLSEEDYGTLDVGEGEYILEAAEAQGMDWPFSCRAGACANCAGIVKDGDIEMDMQQILSDEEIEDENVRLTCIGSPAADEVQLVYNAKHLEFLQDRVI